MTVLATVRDKHGNIINNLTQDDFHLQQDGQPQTIRYFTRETDLPLTLGLLVDTSLSQRRLIEQERVASYAFLNEFMRVDKDKAFVIHFDWGAELLQDLTTDHQKLQVALDKLDMPGSNAGGGPRPANGDDDDGRRYKGGSTTMYDAIFLASDELMQKQQGRKALILLTDGVDEGSRTTLNRAIEAAQRSNTLVYSILYADPEAYGHQRFTHSGGLGGGGGMGHPGGGLAGRTRRTGWRAATSAARRTSRRQEGFAAHCAGNRRTFLRSVQERSDRQDLRFRSPRNCATSTALATRPTRPSPVRGITRSRSPRRTKT